MTTAASTRPNLFKVIAGAGLVAGTLDIATPLTLNALHGVPPVRILQGIASGLLGRASYTQGLRSAAFGLFLHFFIAYTVATIYILASRRLPLSRHPLLYGTLYGIAVYIVMNYVVLPLSRIGLRPFPHLIPLIIGVVTLIVCIGLPLAFIARRYVPYEGA
jgi:uncharacterized membrane protein YagU involved in acid resistance